MGVSMSTLGGWAIIFSIAGYYGYRYISETRVKDLAKAATQRQRVEDRHNLQSKKETKEKAKRQRGEAYSKDVDDADKMAKSKARVAKPVAPPVHNTAYSSDDGVDNREFAKQLASVKQGTNFDGARKTEQKKQKSVKQSRAREIDAVPENRPSAPSSTAGVDADDDEASIPSPEVRAADAGDVSDMLEPKSAGPSVLRLTDTDKVKPKEKRVKEPERVETKKQRQNRQKTEAAKALREETEKDRKVAMEAQRRLARISEGRAAKDGSTFTAAQAKPSVWNGNGSNGKPEAAATNGGFIPVQPLDTFNAPAAVQATPAPAPVVDKNEDWMSSLPSEEEQMEQLLADEDWNTVPTKKSTKSKKKGGAPESENDTKGTATPVVSQPVAAKAPKPSKPAFGHQSSFAALSTDEPEEVEEEWDV